MVRCTGRRSNKCCSNRLRSDWHPAEHTRHECIRGRRCRHQSACRSSSGHTRASWDTQAPSWLGNPAECKRPSGSMVFARSRNSMNSRPSHRQELVLGRIDNGATSSTPRTNNSQRRERGGSVSTLDTTSEHAVPWRKSCPSDRASSCSSSRTPGRNFGIGIGTPHDAPALPSTDAGHRFPTRTRLAAVVEIRLRPSR